MWLFNTDSLGGRIASDRRSRRCKAGGSADPRWVQGLQHVETHFVPKSASALRRSQLFLNPMLGNAGLFLKPLKPQASLFKQPSGLRTSQMYPPETGYLWG